MKHFFGHHRTENERFALTVVFMTLMVVTLIFLIAAELNIPNLLADVSKETDDAVSPIATSSVTKDTEAQQKTVNDVVSVSMGTTTYIVVIDSCNAAYEGACLVVRSGPGTEFPIVTRLRSGVVLRAEPVNQEWYEVRFDEWLRYPERVSPSWFVAAAHVTVYQGKGIEEDNKTKMASTSKKIVIDRSDQSLTATDGEAIFLSTSISTGLELTPTPRGEFTVFKKTPTRYMQGPLPYLADKSYYDLPGVPWNLYFTEGGAAIHGTYWHDSFGSPYSHGCVNLKPEEAQTLYQWAPLGTVVVVQD